MASDLAEMICIMTIINHLISCVKFYRFCFVICSRVHIINRLASFATFVATVPKGNAMPFYSIRLVTYITYLIFWEFAFPEKFVESAPEATCRTDKVTS